MIPNLALMVCAYVVFRCVETLVKEKQRGVVVVFAVICIVVSVVTTFSTLVSGSNMGH